MSTPSPSTPSVQIRPTFSPSTPSPAGPSSVPTSSALHVTSGPGASSIGGNTPRLSPILTHRPLAEPLSPIHPEYAEILTPLKLRRRRRGQATVPTAGPSFPLVGPSTQGYTTEEGDVYRGATFDPRLGIPPVEDDAVTLGGTSTTSSSSSWSWASDIERGRRATMAVIERFGERLGVRRGSNSSGSSDAGSSSAASGHTRASGLAAVVRRRSRRLSRTTTRDSSPDRPKRQHLPRKREFTLLLPPPDATTAAALTTGGDALNPLSRVNTPRGSVNSATNSDEAVSTGGTGSADRLITTPELAVVLDKIRALRLAAGIGPETPSATPGVDVIPVRRGGSAPGRSRPRLRQATGGSFPNPPIMRPSVPRSKSRLEILRGQSNADVPRPKSVSDLMGMTNPYGSSSSLSAMRSASDFKMPSRTSTPLGSPAVTPGAPKQKESGKGCWWLDVACPGWEDLRDIGELLGLHPLTLEDVLQQDPREKFDTFDRLGYYFVVIRALDEEYFKYTPGSATTLVGAGEKVILEKPALSVGSPPLGPSDNDDKNKEGRRRGWGMGRATGKNANKEGEKVEIVEDNPGKEGLEGVGVGALNVYLVVFADGVVSFHFEDISKHTKRVLDRVLSNVSVKASPGADWIAHGLIDSIVDAFFPLIRFVDGEVDDIDSLTVDPSTDPKALHSQPVSSGISASTSNPTLAKDSPPLPPTEDSDSIEMHEKGAIVVAPAPRPPLTHHLKRGWKAVKRARRALLPSIHLPHQLVYLKLFFLPTTSAVKKRHAHPDNQVMGRMEMVRHITHMRKLVTGMTRLLGTKHSVIGEMRKRVAEYGSGQGVDVYIGDVEDHILLLQNSLLHYEYILSHCQPAYLSHLSLSFKIAKGRSDQAILALSTVAIGVLPMQFVTTTFGMNVLVLGDGQNTGEGETISFYWFGGIVCVLFLVICGMVTILRWWRWDARVKWAKKRGADVPDKWDGYWGFR